MTFRNLMATFALAFCASPSWAETASLETILSNLRSSTDTVAVQVWGQQLASYQPKTAEELKLVLDALQDDKLAPYAQSAMASMKDPALGSVLHEGLKALMVGLQPLTKEQAQDMTRTEERLGTIQALSLASVIHVLGSMKYAPAASDLRELLDYSEEFQGYISYAASQALGKMGDEQAYQMIMVDLESGKAVTPSGYGVRAIEDILAKIEQINTTYATKPKISNDPRSEQIDELAQKLKGMGKRDLAVRKTLRRLLKHPLWQVRNGASRAMISSLQPQDKVVALEMLRNDDNLVRMRGLEALLMARTWDKSFLPVMIGMIQNDPDDAVRDATISLLRRLIVAGVRRSELEEAVPYLKAALQDSNYSIRAAGFDTLRAITGRFYPYEGMTRGRRNLIKSGPAYRPEDTTRSFYGTQ